MPKPQPYSVNSPMADKPYAIGERPGGNYIPTIPLLSGTDAWDSLTSYYTPSHKTLGYDTRAKGPRQMRDLLNKAAHFVPGFALLWGTMRNNRELMLEKTAAYKPLSGFQECLAEFIADCPAVYGFVQHQMEKGASYEEAAKAIHQACNKFPKFAEACLDANLPLQRFEIEAAWLRGQLKAAAMEKQAFGSVNASIPGYNAPAHSRGTFYTPPRPKAKDFKITPGVSQGTSMQRLSHAELGKLRDRYSAFGDRTWGEGYREGVGNWSRMTPEQQQLTQHRYNPYYNYDPKSNVWQQQQQAIQQHNDAYAKWRDATPDLYDPSTQQAPQFQIPQDDPTALADWQHRLATDYWLGNEMPQGFNVPEGALPKGDPTAVENFQGLVKRTGLDPYTLMRGIQAEQAMYSQMPELDADFRDMAAKKHQAWLEEQWKKDPEGTFDPNASEHAKYIGEIDREKAREVISRLPEPYQKALRAWQSAQKNNSDIYRGVGYQERSEGYGGRTYPGADNPAWIATLAPGVRERVMGDDSMDRRWMNAGKYMGRPDDWTGMEGMFDRWNVDPREEQFQKFWDEQAKLVQQHGWGKGDAPSSVMELPRRYAQWKQGQIGLLEGISENKAPWVGMQRFLGYRRWDPRTGKEITTVPSAGESAFGPGWFNNTLGHVGGVGRTVLSGLGALPAVGVDLVNALGGNTDFSYSKSMGRSLMQYPNDLMGTDIGHNVEMVRPYTGEGEAMQGKTPRTGNFGFWANPFGEDSSAAAYWAQQQGFKGDEGQLSNVANYYDEMANDPNADYKTRAGAQTMASILRYSEVPLEFFATGKAFGGLDKALRAPKMVNQGTTTLGRLGNALRPRSIPAGPLSKPIPLLSRTLQGAETAANTGGRWSSFLADPRMQAPLAMIEQAELGDGNRVKDWQEQLARQSRAWGAQPTGNPVLSYGKNMLGELGATLAEAGPYLPVAGLRGLFNKNGPKALGGILGSNSNAWSGNTIKSTLGNSAKSMATHPFLAYGALHNTLQPTMAVGRNLSSANPGTTEAVLAEQFMRKHPNVTRNDEGQLMYTPGKWWGEMGDTWQDRQRGLERAAMEQTAMDSILSGQPLDEELSKFVQGNEELTGMQQYWDQARATVAKAQQGLPFDETDTQFFAGLDPDSQAQLEAAVAQARQQGAETRPTPGAGNELAQQGQLPPAYVAEQAKQTSPEQNPELFGLDPNKVKDLPPETTAAVGAAATQVLRVAEQHPEEVEAMRREVQDPNSPTSLTAQKKLGEQLGPEAQKKPETIMQIWENMDDGAKVLVGLGVALGTVSLISSLTSEEGGTMGFLGSVLGFGVAAGTLANTGMFGPDAQKFTNSLMGYMGLGSQQTEEDSAAAAKRQEEDAAALAATLGGQPAEPTQVTQAPPDVPPGATTDDLERMQEPAPGQPAAEQPAPQPAAPAKPPANPHQSAFAQLIGDNKITPQELSQITSNPKLQEYVFGLDDPAARATLRALGAGDPKMKERLASIKKHHKAYGGDIATAMSKRPGEQTYVGPYLLGDYVPGMGFTPEQAQRFVELASQL